MKAKEFINKYAKVYMIIGIIILVGTIGVTYAYYSAAVSNNTDVTGQAGGGDVPTLTINMVSTGATGNLIPINMDTATLTRAASASTKCVDNNGYSSCQIYSVTVTNNSDISQSYNIKLSSLSGENTPNVDAVSMGTSNNSVTDASSIKGGNICTTNSVGKGKTTNTCYFMVLIKNLDTAQTDRGTFGGTVTATSTTGTETKASFGDDNPTLIEHITNLYTNASKSVVTNNGINYNYATSVRLMNDRQGSNDVDANSGNIRYYGADDSNLKNYIYFNCSDYNNQSSSTCETWRIIGIVDGKVKLIRNESIGDYAWDESWSNDWSTASLNTILNDIYYNRDTEIRDAGDTIIDFSLTGITEITRSNNLISESNWYINGAVSGEYANESYIGERTGNNTWPGKIALVYLSDYAYSVDSNNCSDVGYNYSLEACISLNWMASVFMTNNNHRYSLITSNPSDSDLVWYVFEDGSVDSDLVTHYSPILPTLYLNPTLSFNSLGDGSSGNPYQLLVS